MAGRLELQNEARLPSEADRLLILQDATQKLPFLADDLSLKDIAARTANYTVKELAFLVSQATTFPLNRQLQLHPPVSLETVTERLTAQDFYDTMCLHPPHFGFDPEILLHRTHGMLQCTHQHSHIRESAMALVEQLKNGRRGTIVTCLLEGPRGSGKTSLAATIGEDGNIPFVKRVAGENMINLTDKLKCDRIKAVFQDAYHSECSLVILDNIERLVAYNPLGAQFSGAIANTLSQLMKRPPPTGNKLLVVGTTSAVGFLDLVGFRDWFSSIHHVPLLTRNDARQVLQQLDLFIEADLDRAAEILDNVAIKSLFSAVEFAAVKVGATGNIDIAEFFTGVELFCRRP